MNILSISSILPVPGYLKTNDFVFELYTYYLKEYKGDRIFFIFPNKYITKFTKRFINGKVIAFEIGKFKKYNYEAYEINILKYLSTWRFRNLHSVLSYTLYFFNRKFIKKFVVENKIDVIHSQFIFPDSMLAYKIWKKFKIPYIVTSHNELEYFRHSISKRLSLKIFKNAHCVTPLSYINYKAFLEAKLTDIHHTPLGFNEKFLGIKKTKSTEEVRIITIASLIKLKNIDKVIIALSKLNKELNFRYTIVGDGPEKNNLNTLIGECKLKDKIKLIGQVAHEKISNILREHDIFIMPSYFETFGRVYFEAMALEIPVICAKNSGIFGFYKDMEEGISVDHTDINDIANKLELLIADEALRTRIGKKGHELVRNYTWKNIAVIYNTIYKKALSKTYEENSAHI